MKKSLNSRKGQDTSRDQKDTQTVLTISLKKLASQLSDGQAKDLTMLLSTIYEKTSVAQGFLAMSFVRLRELEHSPLMPLSEARRAIQCCTMNSSDALTEIQDLNDILFDYERCFEKRSA